MRYIPIVLINIAVGIAFAWFTSKGTLLFVDDVFSFFSGQIILAVTLLTGLTHES